VYADHKRDMRVVDGMQRVYEGSAESGDALTNARRRRRLVWWWGVRRSWPAGAPKRRVQSKIGVDVVVMKRVTAMAWRERWQVVVQMSVVQRER
jgi:hypothetical protein